MSEPTTEGPDLSGSTLYKTARLATNDDPFRERVTAACWQAGYEYDDSILRAVAGDADVVAATYVGPLNVVYSDRVTDAQIIAAVTAALTEGA